MKGFVSLVLLLHVNSLIHALKHDHEQNCDKRILPGFEKCLCDYDDRKDDMQYTIHDLTVINCTNLGKDSVQSRLMLTNLSSTLVQVGYTGLQELIFVGNDIYDLPANLVGKQSLAFLERLDLSNNGIHTIRGKTFHSMPSLIELFLDNNEWHVDPRSSRVFSSIFNIEILSMNNAFTTSEQGSRHVTSLSVVFEDSKLDYLRELYLENNHFLEVSAPVFQRLPSLELLSLANNNINKLDGIWNSTCLPSEYVDKTMLLDRICPLKTLDLRNNQITTIHQSFVDQMAMLPHLKAIRLENNPFTCDCHLLPFFDFIAASPVVNASALMCVEPADMNGKSLDGIAREDLVCNTVKTGTFPVKVKHENVAGIVFGVLAAIVIVVVGIAVYINRDSVKNSLSRNLPAVKRYLPFANSGYKRFEFKDEKVEPVGV